MIKGIMPTEKGMYIIDALEKTVPDMLSVDMTGDMEMELDKIARGKSDGNDFLNNYKKLVAKWVELIKNSDTSAMAGNTLICPLCGKPLIKKKSVGAVQVIPKITRIVADFILQMKSAVKKYQM